MILCSNDEKLFFKENFKKMFEILNVHVTRERVKKYSEQKLIFLFEKIPIPKAIFSPLSSGQLLLLFDL